MLKDIIEYAPATVELGTAAFRFTQHGEQALDDPLAGVGEVDGAHLGHGEIDLARHNDFLS